MIKSIKLQMALLACLILLVAVNCQAQSNERPARPKRLTIVAMQAKLFFEDSGNFSPDVFTNYVNLFNNPIESSSNEGASESMLVTVEVKAEGKDWYPTGRKVQLTARYRIADSNGRSRPAFFLRRLAAGSPHSGSSRMALACSVRTSVTTVLKSCMSASLMAPPFSFSSAFLREPR